MGQVRGRDARRGDAGAITRLRGERTGGWLFDSAHRALRSVAERYRAADRRDDPRDGARDPPGSLPVVPGAGRPAAAAVLGFDDRRGPQLTRSAEHTTELQSIMSISYAVLCLKKKNNLT